MADNRKMAAQCWRTGTEAMQKENWQYAVQMFQQCVRFEPGNLLFRQTLRGVEKKMYGNNKTGAKMGGMKLMGPKGRIKKCRMQKDWEGVDKAVEEGLAINPWDAQLHADLGDACLHMEFKEVAAFAYENAVECDSANKDFLKSLAEIYEDRGDYKLATGCWERICKLDPMDGTARQRAQQAATKQVIDRGGYEGADNTRGVMADHEVAKRIGRQSSGPADGPGQSEEADMQRAIRKEPDNKDNYINLGEHYRRNKKLEEAGQMFEKALELSGGDVNIRELVEDIELEKLRKNLELAKAQDGDEQTKQNIKDLSGELLKRETEVLRTRVERYTADLRLKFQLAECLMKLGQWAAAIPLLQQASQDSRIETKALSSLGKCFMQEKKYPLARRQFEKAAPKLNAHDNPELFKDVYYWLGRLCEAASDNEVAEGHYSEVLTVDYEYKDTLARLEKLQGG